MGCVRANQHHNSSPRTAALGSAHCAARGQAELRGPGSMVVASAKRRSGPRLKAVGECRHSSAGVTVGWLQRGAFLLGLFTLAGCATAEELPPPHVAELSQLPGWHEDATFQAYPALLASCGVIETLSSDRALGIGGSPTEWREACGAINQLKAALVADTDQALRRAMEAEFVALDPGAGNPALITGYYEPELTGSRIKDAAHPYPLYRRPPDPTAFDRAEIDGGALAGKRLELLWVNDRVEAFFLQVQGSGRVRLANGEVVR